MGGKQSAHDGSRVAEHLTLSTHKPPRQGFRVIKLGIIIIRHSKTRVEQNHSNAGGIRTVLSDFGLLNKEINVP